VNTLRKDKVVGMLGALTGVAGALLVAAMVIPADPLGRLIGALLGASVAVGFVGTLFRGSSFHTGAIRRGPRPSAMPLGHPSGPVAVATLASIDATVWTFEEKAPGFAVVSLTEARVQRRQVEPAPCEAIEA